LQLDAQGSQTGAHASQLGPQAGGAAHVLHSVSQPTWRIAAGAAGLADFGAAASLGDGLGVS